LRPLTFLAAASSGLRPARESRWSKNMLVPRSRPTIRDISSSLRLKSKTSRFCVTRSLRTDFGMTTTPRWIVHRRAIWATDLSCASAMPTSVGLVKKPFFPSAKAPQNSARVAVGPSIHLLARASASACLTTCRATLQLSQLTKPAHPRVPQSDRRMQRLRGGAAAVVRQESSPRRMCAQHHACGARSV